MKQLQSAGAVLFHRTFGLCSLVLVLVTFTLFLYVNFFAVFDHPKSLLAIRGSELQNLSSSRDIDSSAVQAVRKPYRFDKACANFTKRLFRPGFFNLTALVSFPGSGNTWTRHMIELSTGIYTGSIYFDFEIIAKGFLGEKEAWTSGTTIVQKTHEKFNQNSLFTKAILLIRDPYKTIVSFVQFLEVGHTAASSGHIFHKEGWENYTLGQTYKWISLIKSWIESPIPLQIVHYEFLKESANLQFEMLKICDFLLVECIHVNSSCFRRHREGEFHRTRKLPIVPPFPLWVRRKIDNGIDYVNELLERTRGESLPLNLYPYYRNYSSTYTG